MAVPETTSLSLLQKVRFQDSSAWQQVVKLYGPLIYHWCRQRGLQPNDAADVAQEVFRSVFTSLETFRYDRPGDSFRAWLWKITENKVRDHFRKLAVQPAGVGGTNMYAQFVQVPEQLDESRSDSVSPSIVRFVRRVLESVRSEFESQTWQAFWQTTVQGRPSPDVAAELGMSAGSVRQAKYRVLRRLRLQLDEPS